MPARDAEKPKKLPLLYRIILKFPKLSLEGFSMEFQGIFWAIIMPILLTCYGFIVLLFIFYLSPPLNMLAILVATAFICGLCLRIIIDRELKLVEAKIGAAEGFEWNLKKSIQEYAGLIKKEESE